MHERARRAVQTKNKNFGLNPHWKVKITIGQLCELGSSTLGSDLDVGDLYNG